MLKWVITNSGNIFSETSVSRRSLESENIVLVKRHSANKATVNTNEGSTIVVSDTPSRVVSYALSDVAFCAQCWGLMSRSHLLGMYKVLVISTQLG